MARRAIRRRVRPPVERWQAVRDGAGRWIVVDAQGRDVLRDPDTVGRLRAAHLAAAAPGLLEALRELVRRLAYLELPYTRDSARVLWAQDEIAAAMPPADALLEAMHQRVQLELDLGTEVA